MSKKTSLYYEHINLNARMVEFCNWEMPIFYSGIINEHKAVREAAGLFDASHMGEIFIVGPNALEFVQKVSANDASRLKVGQIQYSFLLNENGGVIDDLLVYKLGEHVFLFVVNAGNTEKDWQWLKKYEVETMCVKICNKSDEIALIAVQGPKAQEIMYSVLGESFAGGIGLSLTDPVTSIALLNYYHFSYSEICGKFVLISRTGYTGEDGFEIFCHSEDAVEIWKTLLDKGKSYGLAVCGLGARNTLRLEAGMPLWGHELNENCTPLEAHLRYIGWQKKDFIGKQALNYQAKSGVNQYLTGFIMNNNSQIARDGYEVYDFEGKNKIGIVTSGAPSPTLSKNIGIAYLCWDLYDKSRKISIKIENSLGNSYCPATTVPLPFYRQKG